VDTISVWHIVSHIVDALGTNCFLVVVKPFPLQYSGKREPEHEETPERKRTFAVLLGTGSN
jgi:hypothetical protein